MARITLSDCSRLMQISLTLQYLKANVWKESKLGLPNIYQIPAVNNHVHALILTNHLQQALSQRVIKGK